MVRMVFGNKRRKGRSASTSASKRLGRESQQAAEETAKVKVTPSLKLKETQATKFAKTPEKPTKPRVRTNTSINDQDIELSITTTSPLSFGPSVASSPTEADEGFEAILESRSPRTIDRRVSSSHKEARDTNVPGFSPNKEKNEFSKTTPSNPQSRRGFFRNPSLPSLRNGRKPGKGLTIMEPLESAPSFHESPSFQLDEKKSRTQTQKKPSVLSSKGKPPLGRPVPPGRASIPNLEEKRSMVNNGDESTGLKIVVFDNENKAERRVRVTLLDTNKTVNLQGEKIDPFLSVILREAVRTNQNIHIENGNMDDSRSFRSTGLARTVSFLKEVVSDTTSPKKDLSPSKEPELQKTSSKAMEEAERQSLLEKHIKRVVGGEGSDDNDYLLEANSSIVGRDKVGKTQKSNQKSGKRNAESGGSRVNKDSDIGVKEKPDLKLTQTQQAPGHEKPLELPTPPQSPQMTSKNYPQPEEEANQKMTDDEQQQGFKTKSDDNQETFKSDESSKKSTTPSRRRLTWAETFGIFQPGSPSNNDEEADEEISIDSLHFGPGNLFRSYESFSSHFRSHRRSAKEKIESKNATTHSKVPVSSAQVDRGTSASRVTQDLQSREAKVEAEKATTGDSDENQSIGSSAQKTGANHGSREAEMEAEEDAKGDSNANHLTGSSTKKKGTNDECEDGYIDKDSSDIVKEAAPTQSECVLGDDTSTTSNKTPVCISSSERGNRITEPTQNQKNQLIQGARALQEADRDDAIAAIRTGMLLAKQLGLLQGADGQKTADAVLELAKQIVGDGGLELRRPALTFHSLPALEASSVQTEKHPTKETFLPVVETVRSMSSDESNECGKDVAFKRERPGTNCAVGRRETKAINARNKFFSGFSSRNNAKANLRVLPMERAKKAVESAVQTAVRTTLADDFSFESAEESTLFTNSHSVQEESDEDIGSSLVSDSNSFSSSFLGSSDVPDDDSYSNGFSSGHDDDSTLGTAATLDDLMTWAQEHNEDPDNVVLFGDRLNSGTRTVSVVTEGSLGEIEMEANDEQCSIISVKGAPSFLSEENGYNQFQEQTTPLMEAFVFYVENTFDTMNKVKKAKKRARERSKKKIDGNLTYVSEGLLQSFVKTMGKEETNKKGEPTGGGRGLASTEPVKAADERPLNETDEWGDIVQQLSDDMVRGAFGLITSALTEEMTGFTPTETQAKS